MPGGVVNVLSSLVYIGIFVWLTKSVYFGPYQRYLNNDTKIVEDWADPDDLNGTQYPTVVFCKLPGYRNENPFLREAIEDQRILNNFTGYVNYQYLNRASEVLRGLLFMDNVQEIASTIDPDEVFRPVLSDCRRFGRCFAAETKDLIAQADHLKDTDEPAILTFTLVFDYEGINRTDISTFPLYIVYFMDSHEELVLSGAANLKDTAGSDWISIHPTQGTFYNADTVMHRDIRRCDRDNKKLSQCLQEYLENKYGRCNVEDIGTNCSYEEFRNSCIEMEMLKIQSMNFLTRNSNCELPCERFSYAFSHVITDKALKVVPSTQRTLPEFAAAVMIGLPVHVSIRRKREELEYPFSNFLADVGGYSGLSLGMSMWGIYTGLLPLAVVLKKKLVAT